MTQAQLYLNRLLQILAVGGSVREEVLATAELDVRAERNQARNPQSN